MIVFMSESRINSLTDSFKIIIHLQSQKKGTLSQYSKVHKHLCILFTDKLYILVPFERILTQ